MKRDNRPVIVTFAVAIFVLGMLAGAYITSFQQRKVEMTAGRTGGHLAEQVALAYAAFSRNG